MPVAHVSRPTHRTLSALNPSAGGISWEFTLCPLCRADDYSPFIQAVDPTSTTDETAFSVVRCRQCQLVYTNPRPDVDSIARFYSENYRPHHKPHAVRRPLRRWHRLAGFPDSRGRERRRLPLHGQGRLLDFGCGGGSFIQRMAEQGWAVTGVDVSEAAVRQVREEVGLPALQGTLPHPALHGKSFDVLTMWHSLEHVHQPLEVLRAGHDILVPGGRLIIAVPNMESWPFRWFGSAWFGLDLPRHLTHFTPTTLRAMVESAGFEVEAIRLIRHADWLRSSAKIAIRQGLTSPWKRLLRHKPLARLAAWGCYLARASDCMMGLARKSAK